MSGVWGAGGGGPDSTIPSGLNLRFAADTPHSVNFSRSFFFFFSLKIWLSLAYIKRRMPTITVERRLLKAAVPVNTSKRDISSQLLLCCLCCKSG